MSEPRVPVEVRPPRMEALSRLPVFLALEGKRSIVAGDTPAAAWKAELLSAAGATVDVFAPEPCEELAQLALHPPRGIVTLHRRAWLSSDFAGAAIAIGACGDDTEAARFAEAARSAGVPVNVIDRPAHCDFAFGAIVNRSPLVIGISTDGAAPVFGQAIRAKLESLIPAGFALWADAARRWRRSVQSSGLSFNGRRRFWQLFTAHAVTHPNDAPMQADYDSLLGRTQGEGAGPDAGSVTLVGAGPGDPELLTLRAVRALQSADIILIDDLVSSQILDFARREAKKMMVGKTGHGPSCKQEEINALMVSLAKAGKRVVRLKGGDPMIFGRAGEEIAACRDAGIAIEIVPGISAAQGAASRLGVSLSHRKLARRIQYVAGHAFNGKLPDDLDWQSLADPSATTALYMPKRTLAEFSRSAMDHGLDVATPVVAVLNATRADEQTIHGVIGNIAEKLDAAVWSGPVVVMIGAVFAQTVAREMPQIETAVKSGA